MSELPSDYEPCGECGFDHSYEQADAIAAHWFIDNQEDDLGSFSEKPTHNVDLHNLSDWINNCLKLQKQQAPSET
jgi:hypothetical protein